MTVARSVAACMADPRDDVNVIIPVRDRCDHRIVNALRSLRAQHYDPSLIAITVVDYDSRAELISAYRAICDRYGVTYLRVENKPVWCKSHALNIAIRRTSQKYILASDVDIIFEQRYIAEAVAAVRSDPYQVVLARLLDLPEPVIDARDLEALRLVARHRYGTSSYAVAIPFALAFFFKHIRGYDEFYKLWGKEDDDLIKRFLMLGLRKRILESSFHLHQWHPKHEGVEADELARQLPLNERRLARRRTLRRNRARWGDADVLASD